MNRLFSGIRSKNVSSFEFAKMQNIIAPIFLGARFYAPTNVRNENIGKYRKAAICDLKEKMARILLFVAHSSFLSCVICLASQAHPPALIP
jgi:hypothetical protein